MTKRNLTLVLLAFGTLSQAYAANNANITGGSSNKNRVQAMESSPLPFGAGRPGLSFFNDGNWSNSINLENGPIKHINKKFGAQYNWWNNQQTTAATPINGNNVHASVNGNANPKFLTISDVNPVLGWFNNATLGQVWYENRDFDTGVYSVRQIANPSLPMAPKFGGLVIAKVPDLPQDGHVYFGEWAPRAGNPSAGSNTDLNMAHPEHTVWYVGENPTGNTQNLATATYNVLGVNRHTPGQNDFYTGSVTAQFGTTKQGSMSGSISRGNDTLDFTNAYIDNKHGNFASASASEYNSPLLNSEGIQGKFYGAGAAAMAGIATRGTSTSSDDIAFGGHKQ